MKVGDKYKPNNKNSLCNYIVITIDIDALRKWGYKFNHKIKY